ncbi:hypothetical protein BDY24DRAFT_221914 [Mrakia frigida]|uniref:uncharacterized protein n=1 Tax=Mrakia frigida TaxID=29902 RepID=UPI003FCC1B0D
MEEMDNWGERGKKRDSRGEGRGGRCLLRGMGGATTEFRRGEGRELKVWRRGIWPALFRGGDLMSLTSEGRRRSKREESAWREKGKRKTRARKKADLRPLGETITNELRDSKNKEFFLRFKLPENHGLILPSLVLVLHLVFIQLERREEELEGQLLNGSDLVALSDLDLDQFFDVRVESAV